MCYAIDRLSPRTYTSCKCSNLLLKQTGSFDLALSSVRIYLEGCGAESGFDTTAADDESVKTHRLNEECERSTSKSVGIGHKKYRDLFKQLEENFTSDPEHTSIRLVHLKFAFSFSHLFSGSASLPCIGAKRKWRGDRDTVNEDR